MPVGLTRRILWLARSAMYIDPSGPNATSYGVLSRAEVAGPPSPLLPAVPVPATVEMVPPGVTWRILLLPESAMNRLPAASNASRTGALSRADVAGPPSPVQPDVPVPAMVTTVPSVLIAAYGVRAGVGDVHAVLAVDRDAPGRVEPHRHRLAPITRAVRRRAIADGGPQHVPAAVLGGVRRGAVEERPPTVFNRVGLLAPKKTRHEGAGPVVIAAPSAYTNSVAPLATLVIVVADAVGVPNPMSRRAVLIVRVPDRAVDSGCIGVDDVTWVPETEPSPRRPPCPSRRASGCAAPGRGGRDRAAGCRAWSRGRWGRATTKE